MLNRERYPLFQIISDDFINHNKLPVLLLLGIVFTAIGTVWVTHQTRLLTAEQGQYIQENRKLDNQYIHLQLEENSKSQKARVEAAAKTFGLQSIQKEQEVILVE